MSDIKKSHPPPLFLGLHFAFITFGPLVGFLVLGKFADDYFNTSPIILIIGIVLGVFVSFYEMYEMMREVMKR